MQQRTLARIMSATLAGSVMAALPAIAVAASKTAVKIQLTNHSINTTIIASPRYPLRFSWMSQPYLGGLNSVVVSSLTPETCQVSYPMEFNKIGVYTPNPGVCRFRVSVADTAKYSGAVEYSFTIPKSQQPHYYPLLVAPEGLPTPARLDGRDNVYAYLIPMSMNGDAWGAELGTPYQVITSDPAVCKATATINVGDEMTLRPVPVAPGDCTITVLRPANDRFEEKRIDWQVRVIGDGVPQVKGDQTIAFPAVASPAIGQSVTLNATGGASGNAVSFSSKTPALCAVEGQVLTALAAGACIVAADQQGNDKFSPAAQQTQTLSIAAVDPAKTPQAITLSEVPSLMVGGTAPLSATGGDSGNVVTFSSQTPALCSVEGNLLTALAAGDCIVVADQQGNDTFKPAAQQTQTISIVAADDPIKMPQTITFNEVPFMDVGGTATLSAQGGDSGNPVSFSSLTPDNCMVVDNMVSGLAAGICQVAADQAGNDVFAAAAQATQSILVMSGFRAAARTTNSTTLGDSVAIDTPVSGTPVSGTPVIDTPTTARTGQRVGIAPLEMLGVGGTATLTAIGGDSGNPVRLSSLTADVCTVSETTLTAVAVGKCTVAANQDGNDTFEPAAQTTLDIAIVKEIYPYSVTVNITGDLTAQTITASIMPASTDAGKNGSEFLAAYLGEYVFLYGTSGWVQYTGADSVVALSSGALAIHEVTLLDNVDMTSLVGAQVLVGYGLGNSLAEAYAEMLASHRVMNVYKVE